MGSHSERLHRNWCCVYFNRPTRQTSNGFVPRVTCKERFLSRSTHLRFQTCMLNRFLLFLHFYFHHGRNQQALYLSQLETFILHHEIHCHNDNTLDGRSLLALCSGLSNILPTTSTTLLPLITIIASSTISKKNKIPSPRSPGRRRTRGQNQKTRLAQTHYPQSLWTTTRNDYQYEQ